MPIPLFLAAILGATAIAGVGTSVAGAVVNRRASREANDTNMDIAQMNNEFNERMMDKQQQYAVENYERQWRDSLRNQWDLIEYNTPANQAQRFREAGINPYLVMSGNNFGVATASAGGTYSSPSAPTASQVQVQPETIDLGGVSDSIAQFASLADQLMTSRSERFYKDSLTSQVNEELKTLNARRLAELNNMVAETRDSNARAALTELQANAFNQQNQLDVMQKQANIIQTRAQTRQILIESSIDYLQLQSMPDRIKLELAEMTSRIGLNNATADLMESNKKLADFEIHNMMQDYMNKLLDNELKGYDVAQVKEWFKHLEDIIHRTLNEMRINNIVSGARGFTGAVRDLSDSFSNFRGRSGGGITINNMPRDPRDSNHGPYRDGYSY